jgi:hypothetical protein
MKALELKFNTLLRELSTSLTETDIEQIRVLAASSQSKGSGSESCARCQTKRLEIFGAQPAPLN